MGSTSRPPSRKEMKSPKAATADDCLTLEQLPNVGPAMASQDSSTKFVWIKIAPTVKTRKRIKIRTPSH